MNAHEIFQKLDHAFAVQIMTYFREESREIYKTTVATLATQRKLRPVFIQKKPVAVQIDWLIKTLKQKSADTVSEHLLQVWLLREKKEMLIMFVDDLGIEHDEDGGVDELPETIDAEKLKVAMDHLLENYPAPVVTLYLRVFQIQQAEGWPEIAEALEKDERLH